MRNKMWVRFVAPLVASGVLLQLGGCGGQNFLIDFAGAGAVVSGLFILLT